MSDEHGSDFVDELMEFLLRNYYSMMIKRCLLYTSDAADEL